MRQETQLTFEQTKEVSYLNTLFGILDKSKKRQKALHSASAQLKQNEFGVKKEVRDSYRKLKSSGLSDYQVHKAIADEHKYKIIYMLRRIKNEKTY